MALKRKNKLTDAVNTTSMTDFMFLLLLFFIIASTMSSPNDMKINLPQSNASTSTKTRIVKVGIDASGNYSMADQGEKVRAVLFEEIEPYVQMVHASDSTMCIALYADENIAYKEVIRVLDLANNNKIKLVIATNSINK